MNIETETTESGYTETEIFDREHVKIKRATELYLENPAQNKKRRTKHKEQNMEYTSSKASKMIVLKPKHKQPFLYPNSSTKCTKKIRAQDKRHPYRIEKL